VWDKIFCVNISQIETGHTTLGVIATNSNSPIDTEYNLGAQPNLRKDQPNLRTTTKLACVLKVFTTEFFLFRAKFLQLESCCSGQSLYNYKSLRLSLALASTSKVLKKKVLV